MVNCEKNPQMQASFCADDMGLGKTMEALAVTLQNWVGSTLVIVPSALIANNWAEQIHLSVTGNPRVIVFSSIHLLRSSPVAIRQLPNHYDYIIVVHSCMTESKKVSNENWKQVFLTIQNYFIHFYLI
jgi:SNF2 family DNA or RNA helicase